MFTSSGLVPSNIFLEGFASIVTVKVGPSGTISEFYAKSKSKEDWLKLASFRDSEWRD